MPSRLITNNFLDLTEVLSIKILSYLEAVHIARCAMTCKSIYRTVSNSPQLEYIILLHLNGFKDSGQSATIPFSVLVTRLRQLRQTYLNPKFRLNGSVQMQGSSFGFDLAGDMFVINTGRSLECAKVPIGNGVSETWPDAQIRIRNFTLDYSQNLIVMVEDDDEQPELSRHDPREMSIYLHDKNGQHPQAPFHSLQFTITPDGCWGNVLRSSFLQVSGKFLAHYYYTVDEQGDSQARVMIWDWQMSARLVDSTLLSPPLLPTRGSFFHLLNSSYFLVLSDLNSGSIHLHALVQSRKRRGTWTTSVAHLATLQLPRTARGVEVYHPFTTHTASRSGKPFYDKRLLESNPDDDLHVFTLTYYDDRHDAVPLDAYDCEVRPSIDLFVHRRIFTKYCKIGEKASNRPVVVPWEDWGPANTRIIYPSRTQTWTPGLHDIHGQRAILQKVKLRHEFAESNEIEVLDFSEAAIMAAKRGETPGKLLPPTRIRTSDVRLFNHEVSTRLPCVAYPVTFQQDYAQYMIHEFGVLGLRMTHSLLPMIRVDSYLF
ncbi:hypothetical protein BDN70DRAFT_899599 [Pholiota conissans]|uniref:F-box domain-containing protein n=1 Tax=Pholiota conissans TaxID=109636 RepID=A0A9P6CP80_9AGAR|nr:hypothetical protein BDN70DRAFT_899599 [Pholiota conissans]